MRTNIVALGAAALAALAACNSGTKLHHCNVDSDCGSGICREGICAVDETAPVVTIEAPVASFVAATATLEVSGTVDDGATGTGVVSVSARLGDGEGVELKLENGRFSGALNIPVVDSKGIEIVVTAKDAAGNVGSASVAGIADRVPPQITFEASAKKVFGLADVGTKITWKFTGSDGSGSVLAEVSKDGGHSWAAVDNGLSFTPEIAVEGNVADANYSVSVRAKDPSGNASEVVVTPGVKVDTVAPTLSIDSPGDGITLALKDSPVLNVNGYVADANLVKVSGLGKDVNPTDLGPMGAFNIDLTVTDEDSAFHMYDIVATDLAGNASVIHRTYVVDRVPPAITIDTPSADGECMGAVCTGGVVNAASAAAGFKIEGTVSDRGGIQSDRIAIELDGKSYDAVLPDGKHWSFTWTAAPTVDGKEYVARITAKDRLGNASTAERKLWVDTVKPTATALVSENPRLPKAAAVVRFSEPMQVGTVPTAGTLQPAASVVLESSDAKTFQFSNSGSALALATTYSLSVGVAALDRAGNPLAATLTERFRTGPVPPNRAAFSIPKGLKPASAVDDDGNPVVVYADGNAANTPFVVTWWDGVSAWKSQAIPGTGGKPCDRPASIVLHGKRDTDLSLIDSIELALCSATSTVVKNSNVVRYIKSGDNFASWRGLSSSTGADVATPSTLPPEAAPQLTISCLAGFGCVTTISYLQTGGATRPFLVQRAKWSSSTGWGSQSAFSEEVSNLGGDMVVGSNLGYVPSGTVLGINWGQLTPLSVYGRTPPLTATGTPSGLVWALAATSDTNDVPRLGLGCAVDASKSASWFFDNEVAGNVLDLLVPVEVAFSAKRVGWVAVGTAGMWSGSIAMPASCSSAPTFAVGTAVARAADPTTAVFEDTAYVFYVDTATSTLKMLP